MALDLHVFEGSDNFNIADFNSNFSAIQTEVNSTEDLTKKDWGTLTIASTDWVGTAAPYTYTKAITGMKVDYNPSLIAIYTSASTVETEREKLSKIYKIDTAEGSITAYSLDKVDSSFKLLGI